MKKLILMKGLPGSGKSTLARKLANELGCSDTMICSADYYFMSDGVYNFDASQLHMAHKSCMAFANSMMQHGTNYIIIDNCNLKGSDRKPYIDMANQYGYEVIIIEPDTVWKDNPEECCKHTIHGVPLESIERMKAKAN